MIEEWLPTLAIGGGFVLMFAIVCIALWITRRRRYREDPRRTSFHMTVIDPQIARHRRAAWEHSMPPSDESVIVEELELDIEIDAGSLAAPDRTVIGYSAYAALLPQPRTSGDARPPHRLARGSTPAMKPTSSTLPARPTDWELCAPSVTARMRAAKRT